MYHKLIDFDPKCVLRRAPGGDPCIVFSHTVLNCPAGNLEPNRAVDKQEGEYPLIRCRVCDLLVSEDSDMRASYWTGTVEWGPNQFGATISETSIDSYRVYVADEKLRKLGPWRAFVEAKVWANLFNPRSCNPDYYRAHLEIYLPKGAVYFMVVPFTRGGVEMNIGPVKRLVDLGTLVGGPATNQARRLPAVQWLPAALMGAVLLACI